MLSVSTIQDNDLWKNYFIEKPLTLEEFVSESPTLNQVLFPHIKELIHSLSEHPYNEVYFQTPIGLGKSMAESILCAYSMYLFCIHKDIDKTLGFAPSVVYSFGILGTRKTCGLTLESLFNIFQQIPRFCRLRGQHDNDESNRGKICYCTNCENAIMDVFYIAPNGARGVPLKVIPVQTSADIIGTTLIGVYFSELSSFMEISRKTSEDIFELMNKARDRIDSRFGPRDKFMHILILDKDPNDIEDDVVDAYIQNIKSRISDERQTVVTFKRRWELFPEEYSDCKYIWFDIASEEIEETETKYSVKVPEQYKSTINLCPKQFIRDYLGIPTSLVENPSRMKLKKYKSDLLLNNIKIIMEQGSFYFLDKESGLKLPIYELFL